MPALKVPMKEDMLDGFKAGMVAIHTEDSFFLVNINYIISAAVTFLGHMPEVLDRFDDISNPLSGFFDLSDPAHKFLGIFPVHFQKRYIPQQNYQRRIQFMGCGTGHLQQHFQSLLFNTNFRLGNNFIIGPAKFLFHGFPLFIVLPVPAAGPCGTR